MQPTVGKVYSDAELAREGTKPALSKEEMQSKVESIYHDVQRLKTSLVSLGEVKEGKKYYYSKEDGCFYLSGGTGTELIESTVGKGYCLNWCMAGARWLSGEDSFKLAKDLGAWNVDILKLIGDIEKVALSSDVKPRLRQALYDKVNSLYKKSMVAHAGLLKLKETYKAELDKQKAFVSFIEKFNDTRENLDIVANKIDKAIKTYQNRKKLHMWQEEQRFRIDALLNRRSVSDVSRSRSRKTTWAPMSGGLYPRELTRQAASEIFTYLEKNKDWLNRRITEENSPLLIQPKESRLTRPLAVFVNKKFVLLEEESQIPGVGKAMQFDYGKMAMVIHSNASDATEIDRASIQLKLMERYKKTDGIVRMKGALTHLSFEKETGNRMDQYIFIRHYDMGSLQHCMRKHSLRHLEKCQVILDVMEGLKALHDDGYVLTTLHPETIVVEKQSRKARKNGVSGALIGLEHVIEKGDREGLTKATDMWLLGQTMYALFMKHETVVLRHLREKDDFAGAVIDVMKCEPFLEPPSIEKKGAVEELILRLISPREEERPTIGEAIELLKRHMHAERKSEALIDRIAESSDEEAV